MDKDANAPKQWKEEKVSIRVKLSVLWIGVMFFYMYADIKAFFETVYPVKSEIWL